jgi:hypothetical protein
MSKKITHISYNPSNHTGYPKNKNPYFKLPRKRDKLYYGVTSHRNKVTGVRHYS